MPGQQEFNRCGVAKWSCVTAPSRTINSTTVQVVNGVPQPRYGSASGTSMAGPHSAAVLALVMQRFPYMTNTQALYTMFTTGRQNNTISDATGAAVPNPDTRRDGAGSRPAQRLAHAQPARRVQGPGPAARAVRSSTRRATTTCGRTTSPTSPSGRASRRTPTRRPPGRRRRSPRDGRNGLPADASDIDRSDFAIGTRREQARNARVYEGSLTKRGDGTLFLTGNDTWHGKSTVLGGKLSVVGSHASSIDVGGGTLGGSGTVAGSIDVAGGVLQPGLAPQEAASIDVPVGPATS